MLKTLTLSTLITALAIPLGSAILLAMPANAGEDCLGLSIGPGCIGIEGDNGHHYRRAQAISPHAHRYVRGGSVCLNSFLGLISGAPAGVKPPRHAAAG